MTDLDPIHAELVHLVIALCDEIKRLQAENTELRHQRDSVTDYLDSIMPTRDYEDLMQRDIPNNPHR